MIYGRMNTAILAEISIIVCPGHYAVYSVIRRLHIPTRCSHAKDRKKCQNKEMLIQQMCRMPLLRDAYGLEEEKEQLQTLWRCNMEEEQL